MPVQRAKPDATAATARSCHRRCKPLPSPFNLSGAAAGIAELCRRSSPQLPLPVPRQPEVLLNVRQPLRHLLEARPAFGKQLRHCEIQTLQVFEILKNLQLAVGNCTSEVLLNVRQPLRDLWKPGLQGNKVSEETKLILHRVVKLLS